MKKLIANNANNMLLILIVAMIFALYNHIFSWLLKVWIENPDYSHGFLIPIISGYIIWKKRKKLKEIPLHSSKWGLFLFIVGLLLEIASVRSTVNFTSAYSFILVLLGLAIYWGGKEMGKELLFPILFLFFMVPFSQFLLDPISYRLKFFSTYFSTEAIKALGIPLYREGAIISLAKGTIEVADPCSGIRSLMSFLMLGTLFAYFASGSIAKKIMLLLITIPLIVFGNSFRILIAILLLHFQGIIISNTHWETTLGVVVFMLVVSGLLLTGRLLKCQVSDLST